MKTDDYPFDLGDYSLKITTTSPDAQIWFDRGLKWTYGYNQEEAVACFRQALRRDPKCAMAWWGVAYAAGPFYNRPWIRFTEAEIAEALPVCHHAAQRALACADGCTPQEIALAKAIALRYRRPDERDHATLNAWHRDFTDAMGRVHADNPDDPDIAALYAEAAITFTPRQLWDLQTGAPKTAALTEEALAALTRAESARAGLGPHPGLSHILIHALEMSPFPERALDAANGLRGLAPDAGHLEHMPAHVYVLCGDYQQAAAQSEKAVRADDLYLRYAGANNFYTTSRCHDLHLHIYAGMFLGQYRTALGAADRIREVATPELIAGSAPFMASILDGYAAMRTHVQVRFGRWRDLIAEAPPPDPHLSPICAAMHEYGTGVAYAAIGEIGEADAALERFRAAQRAIPEEAIFLSNPVRAMLLVGDAMLEGEAAYRRRDYDTAFAALRLAVARDDALNYTEPWAWMHPPRHALGALLAEQGRLDEAAAAYRQDLGLQDGLPRCCQHPDNIWALHGLLECVEAAGDVQGADLLRRKLAVAQRHADIPITSSCFCRRAAG